MIIGLILILVGARLLRGSDQHHRAGAGPEALYWKWLGIASFGSCVLGPAGVVAMIVGFVSLLNAPRYDPGLPPDGSSDDVPPTEPGAS